MNSNTATVNRRLEFKHEASVILFDTSLANSPEIAWFDPGNWREAARPVSGKGGRGSAWFIGAEFGEAVLRHYRRGGWAAKISHDRYLWRDESTVRSVHEFHFMQALIDKDLPVPKPIAAMFIKSGLFYRAAILMQCIPQARSFLEYVHEKTDSAPWAAVGKAIARFHKVGAQHADLNAQNILLDANEKIWLIDWDKARFQAGPGPCCVDVLQRLERSVLKYRGEVDEQTIQTGMQVLHAAHDAELER